MTKATIPDSDNEISSMAVGEAFAAALGNLLPEHEINLGRRFDDVAYQVLLSEDNIDLSAGGKPPGQRQKLRYRRASD